MGIAKDVWDIGERLFRLFRKRREQSKTERVLSVMTQGKNWRRTELAKLAKISDEDALQALHVLKDADKVISLDVNEEELHYLRRVETALDQYKMLSILAGTSYPMLWKKHSGIVNLQCSVHVSSPKRLCQGSAPDGFPDTTHCFPLMQHRYSSSF
ncbi:MAG: hypothetical protein WAQ52_08680 [Terriglobales bacterium]